MNFGCQMMLNQLPGMSEMLQERDIECWIASTLLLVAPYLI
jgi:hypothetical protein